MSSIDLIHDLAVMGRLKPFQAQLHIVGYNSDGEMVGIGHSSPNDLLVRNMGSILSGLLTFASNSLAIFATASPIGGAFASNQLLTYANAAIASAQTITTVNGVTATSGAYVGVGTSSTAPQRGDIGLGGQVGTWVAATGAQYNTGPAQVVVSGAVPITASLQVTEAGIAGFFASAVLAALGPTPILLAHDLITPGVNIPAGGNASVNWALQI